MSDARKKKILPTIDEQEKQRRFEAARSAEASLRISGFIISKETKALTDKWVNGEITDEELAQLSGIS